MNSILFSFVRKITIFQVAVLLAGVARISFRIFGRTIRTDIAGFVYLAFSFRQSPEFYPASI